MKVAIFCVDISDLLGGVEIAEVVEVVNNEEAKD